MKYLDIVKDYIYSMKIANNEFDSCDLVVLIGNIEMASIFKQVENVENAGVYTYIIEGIKFKYIHAESAFTITSSSTYEFIMDKHKRALAIGLVNSITEVERI